MRANLNRRPEVRQPMRPEKNQDDRKAQCFIEKQGIPENVRCRINKFVLKYYTDKKIKCIPQANEQICSSPYLGYVVNEFQSLEISPINLAI